MTKTWTRTWISSRGADFYEYVVVEGGAAGRPVLRPTQSSLQVQVSTRVEHLSPHLTGDQSPAFPATWNHLWSEAVQCYPSGAQTSHVFSIFSCTFWDLGF